MLRRVDAENRLQTLKEELDFQKNIYSEVSITLYGSDYGQLDIGLRLGDSPVCQANPGLPVPGLWS